MYHQYLVLLYSLNKKEEQVSLCMVTQHLKHQSVDSSLVITHPHRMRGIFLEDRMILNQILENAIERLQRSDCIIPDIHITGKSEVPWLTKYSLNCKIPLEVSWTLQQHPSLFLCVCVFPNIYSFTPNVCTKCFLCARKYTKLANILCLVIYNKNT